MRATGQSMRNARALRRSMSLPEVKLWNLLRRSPSGIRFRKQYAVGPYVADFYCPAARLVIEIDGLSHDLGNRPERDGQRDQFIREIGLSIMRIHATEVLRDAIAVADGLIALCADAAGPSTTQLRWAVPLPTATRQGG